MKGMITIAAGTEGPEYLRTVLPAVCRVLDAVAEESRSPYDFVRTWDPSVGAEVIRIRLADTTESQVLEIVRKLKSHGCPSSHRLILDDQDSPDEFPSPLWNAGFGGTGFNNVADTICAATAPILVSIAKKIISEKDSLKSAVFALKLMVAHTAASLQDSPQRILSDYNFRTLMSMRLLSYRSHYEAIVLRTSDPVAFEAACQRFYLQVGAPVREEIERLCDPEAFADDSLILQWTQMLSENSKFLANSFSSGDLVDAGRTLEDLERERGEPVEATRFHAPPTPHMKRLLHEDLDFLTYRLQTSLLYSALHSLGFSLGERYVFCYVVGRASEDVSGKTMLELQDNLDSLAMRLSTSNSPRISATDRNHSP